MSDILTESLAAQIAKDGLALQLMLEAMPTRYAHASYSDNTFYTVPNNAFYRALVEALPHSNYGWSHWTPKHEYPGDYGHCDCESTLGTHIVEYNSFGNKTEERYGDKCPKTFEVEYSYPIGD